MKLLIQLVTFATIYMTFTFGISYDELSDRKCHYQFFFFNDTTTTEIYTLSLHDALPIFNPLFTINVTMRDIKSKNVYSRVNSKATTQWRKTESANGVHLEGVASDNRSS